MNKKLVSIGIINPFGGHAITAVDATGNALFPGISGQSLMSNSKDYSVVCAKHIN